MWLSDSYKIPQELIDHPPSAEFRRFLLDWFGSNQISRIERLRSIDELAPEELPLAQQLVRQNLKTNRNHLINAAWLLRDVSAAPALRMMLETESSESRRLTIAGALWKLVRDPVFIDCLKRSKASGLITGHIDQVLWLDDERALEFLLDMLPAWDHRSYSGITRKYPLGEPGPWALGLLNSLESGINLPPEKQNPPSYYRRRLQEAEFREQMLQRIHAGNEARQFLLL